MPVGDQDLRYYLDELNYLREQGRDFARRYPAVGARLELAAGRPADPHVERLIESFAFLSGRLQRRLDAEFPEISTAMLALLYPQLATIVPPMAIACFEPDHRRAKWTTGYTVEARTPLFARNHQGVPCRFETCYAVTLWPISVANVALDSPSRYDWLNSSPGVAAVVRISLECPDAGFEALSLDRLRFYLDGDAEQPALLYDALATSITGLVITTLEDSSRHRLPKESLTLAGFATDEAVIPDAPGGHAGYRLLHEYFHFPQKFRFADVAFGRHGLTGHRAELLILLDRPLPGGLRLNSASFRLGATPIVNLFRQTSEPLRLDHRQFEYRLVADQRRETTTEIHSVVAVASTSNPMEETRHLEPLYSLRQSASAMGQPGEPRAFWHARRAWRGQEGIPGTEHYLSFFDRDFSPAEPPASTIYAQLLCTNRGLAAQLPAGAALSSDLAIPAASIRCLDKPTSAAYPALGGATIWQLVSSLSLNHLSLGGAEGLHALKRILRLYCPEDRPAAWRPIEGLLSLTSSPCVRHQGAAAWRGFRQGTALTLTLDDTSHLFAGSSRALLAGVLGHFLSLHASVNSFTELAVRLEGQHEDWLRWAPLPGLQPAL